MRRTGGLLGGAPPSSYYTQPPPSTATPATNPFRQLNGKYYDVQHSPIWFCVTIRATSTQDGDIWATDMTHNRTVIVKNWPFGFGETRNEYFSGVGTKTVRLDTGEDAKMLIYDYGHPYSPEQRAREIEIEKSRKAIKEKEAKAAATNSVTVTNK